MKHVIKTAAFAISLSAFGATPNARADHHAEKPAKGAAAAKDKAAAKPGKAAAEVTLKGDMTCAKCGLHEGTKCQNVLKVTDAGKETKYYLADNTVAKDNHGKVCGGSAPATVKGTVAEDAGKKVVTASEIKYQ